MNSLVTIKLLSLFKFIKAKSDPLDGKFIVLKDSDGWANTALADLTNINYDRVLSIALRKKDSLYSFVTNKEKAPKIQDILDTKGDSDVYDIAFDLEHSALKLYGDVIVYINPYLLAYFNKVYKLVGGIQAIKVTGTLSVVKIINNDKVVGLIMPLRIAK